jgi:two-component system LytT family sensor kinase
MNLYDFVFDKRFPKKYYRHIAFWLSWYIYLTLQTLMFLKNTDVPSSKFATVLSFKAFLLFTHLVYTYTVVYYFVPAYLNRNKKAIFFTVAIALAVVIDTLTSLIIFFKIDTFNQSAEIIFLDILNEFRNFIRTGPIVICCLFVACKMAKDYSLKLQEKKALIGENANAELQLLKAQVHPHFLFNTLNNIYSYILRKSPQAEDLITKLSDTMHYMIDDCQAGSVPLEKEIKMIEDYMGLEKVRYGNRLQMDIEVTGSYHNKMIAPLLLIPFIENSFKHGTSQVITRPAIDLKISIEEYQLSFYLTNSRPPSGNNYINKTGIGLKNVKKRLELLFPHRYELTINNLDDAFCIYMRIPLHNLAAAPVATTGNKFKNVLSFQTLSYD